MAYPTSAACAKSAPEPRRGGRNEPICKWLATPAFAPTSPCAAYSARATTIMRGLVSMSVPFPACAATDTQVRFPGEAAMRIAQTTYRDQNAGGGLGTLWAGIAASLPRYL